jgi:SHS family lactate transporter-like MFS transporter
MVVAVICCLLVLPMWVATESTSILIVGVFLMQFFVQGAYGVVPAHINELSPGHLRGFMPGLAYQLGILGAASIPYVESVVGERYTYAQAMGGLMAVVFVIGAIVIALGPEAHRISFRKSGSSGGEPREADRLSPAPDRRSADGTLQPGTV